MAFPGAPLFYLAYGAIEIPLSLLVAFVAASVPFSLLAITQHIQLALLAGGGDLSPDRVAAGIAAYDKWMDVASIFWGLWLAPFGWLILRSGAVPGILGVILILGCIEHLAGYFGPMIDEGCEDTLMQSLPSWTGSVGEVGTCLWLLVMGARGPSAN